MTPKEALKKIKFSLANNLNKITKMGIERHLEHLQNDTDIEIVGNALDELEALKKELAKSVGYCSKLQNELNTLNNDVARYFELDCNLTRDGVFLYSFLRKSKLEDETIQKCENRLNDEFSELKEKLSKAGKEE